MFSDESMDVDPNYDPSDFLLAGLPAREDKTNTENNIAQCKQENQQQPLQQEEDVGGDLWF